MSNYITLFMLCCFARIIPARVPAKNQLRFMAWPFFLEIHILPYGRSLTSMNGMNILVSFLCVFVRMIRIYIYVHIIYAFIKPIFNLSNLLAALANPVVIILWGQSYMESDPRYFLTKTVVSWRLRHSSKSNSQLPLCLYNAQRMFDACPTWHRILSYL